MCGTLVEESHPLANSHVCRASLEHNAIASTCVELKLSYPMWLLIAVVVDNAIVTAIEVSTSTALTTEIVE